MSELYAYLVLIPLLPLTAAVLVGLLGHSLLRQLSHWPVILAGVAACCLSILVLWKVAQGEGGVEHYYTWFQTGDVNVGFNLRADGLSAVMLVMVTFIGTLIVIYSSGYMHHDPGYPRYFAEIALFIFSMTGLVLADNFLVLYAFWEGVGLCSFLLIGYYFTRPSAAAAARKAFLVTRIGDVGLILGIIILWVGFVGADGKNLYSVDYTRVFNSAELNRGLLPAVCLLLFCGAVGKSAQFPLHVWLPDAMEGPSPVSALIHAATMVTAGVYLVARSMPLFRAADPVVLLIVGSIGAISCLLAALIALTQTDLKRVLAYSTISQLGYMFLALGSATTDHLVTLAVVAAIFHLLTHAFFKALLFLSAGSVMHSMGNVIDMRRFSGLRHVLPATQWVFLFGALALAAFPLTAGFWSKDEILAAALGASRSGVHGGIYALLFLVGLITAGLTGYYTFRAYFLTFWGEVRTPPEAGEHPHEAPLVMLVPMMILSFGALFLGIVLGPTGVLSHFLQEHWLAPSRPAEAEGHINWSLMLGSSVFALGGILMAWWMYVARVGVADVLARRMPRLYQASLNRFYIDELYDFFILKPLIGFAEFCRIIDMYVVDSIVDLVGHVPGLVGRLVRPIQNGLVQFYALAMLLGLGVFLSALVWRLAQ